MMILPYTTINYRTCSIPTYDHPSPKMERSCRPIISLLQKTIPTNTNATNTKNPVQTPTLSLSFLSSLASNYQNIFATTFTNIITPPLHPSVDPKLVFTGNFAPVDEHEPVACPVVEGQLPISLNGVYIRNGSNPQYANCNGPLHFFEGDGMIHSTKLSRGEATYCSRYVKTYKHMLEQEAGFPVFPNVISGFYSLSDIFRLLLVVWRVISGHINLMKGFGLANTNIAFFASKLLALGESDLPYLISLTEDGDIRTLGRWEFEMKMFANMTAHPKVDMETKETFAFSCSPIFPYITYFYFNEDGIKQKEVPLPSINQPTFIHDFAITKQFAIFHDTQLVVAPMKLMLARGMPVVYDPAKVPRIGILPRYSTSDSNLKWFSVPGFNAWENGEDEIVLTATNLLNLDKVFKEIEKLNCSLEKLIINTKTRTISRKILSRRNLEMGSINGSYMGKKNRYAYLGISDKLPKMSGLVKIDLEQECEVSCRFYGSGCFGGEPFFVPRNSNDLASDNEDDGFVVTYVHNENSGESRFLVMDAKSPTLDIVAAVKLPRRIPYGFHGIFVNKEALSTL